MSSKFSATTIGAILIALIIGAAAGYLVLASELSTLQADLQKAKEGKAMLEEELKGMTVAIPFTVESGQMAHDVWSIIAPIQGGKYAVAISAQGLEQNEVYIVESVTKGAQMQMVPIASTVPESEFLPDAKGKGLYWIVLDNDPRVTFEKIELLFLPGMQMDKAVLIAVANLG